MSRHNIELNLADLLDQLNDEALVFIGQIIQGVMVEQALRTPKQKALKSGVAIHFKDIAEILSGVRSTDLKALMRCYLHIAKQELRGENTRAIRLQEVDSDDAQYSDLARGKSTAVHDIEAMERTSSIQSFSEMGEGNDSIEEFTE